MKRNHQFLYQKGFIQLLFVVFMIIISSCQESPETHSQQSADTLLNTFELHEGFQIELIADEPLISDPVDMEIDEYGRLYVVEMHGYPLDVSGTGKVRLLSDSNGDGRMDESTIFADSLVLPTGVMRWKKGILVTDPPNVLYLEDSDNDGKADIKKVVLTGFARSNPQHNVNSPRLGLDNWIYLGHESAVTTNFFEEKFGGKGTEVHYPEKPEENRLPINAGGRSIRFRPDTYDLELLSYKTQFGHTYDETGNRFLVSNANHIYQEIISAQYLERNPLLLVADATQSISDHGNAAEVYPITQNPEHQLLTDVGVITSACGITSYSGGAFPGFSDVVFVAEPVSNIIHADKLKSQGASFTASRLVEGKEFLASTDAWFRPVNMYIGPDGALYVVDYYRQIIEHPEWMAEEVVKSGALYNGTDKGRIYRITAKGSQAADWTKGLDLGNIDDEQLVKKLADKNIWWRRNAQRLLIDRKATGVLTALFEMAETNASSLARLHALWTIEGLGKTDPELLQKTLKDADPGVRRNSIKIAELHLSAAPEIGEALIGLKNDNDPKVRFQLLSTLGFLNSPQATQARQELLFKDIEDEWVPIAALSASNLKTNELLDAVINKYNKDVPAYATLLKKLSAMAAAGKQHENINSLISKATKPLSEEKGAWQAAVLEGLAQGIKNQKSSSFKIEYQELIKAAFEHPSIPVRQASIKLMHDLEVSDAVDIKNALEKAERLAESKNVSSEERTLGIDFLTLQNPAAHREFFKELITPGEPLTVQVAALNALSKIPDETVAEYVLEQWSSFTPEIRDKAIDMLMVNNQRTKILLDAMEKGSIQTAALGWRRSVRLMAQENEQLRNQARMLLAKKEGQREEIIDKYKPALEMNGSLDAGKIVFQKNCAVCHTMGPELGTPFGPDIASLRNRRPENIMNDILAPNLSIADGYDLWTVELNDGETTQGIISTETPTAITLRLTGGQENTIARQNIKSLKVMDISAMPEGLENNISQQEMADLLAFIKQIE